MKSTIAIAALIGVAFAASSAFAQNSAPGSTLPKPKAAVMPPPPPPGGPDKLVTRTQPTVPDGPRKPNGPGVVDDLAADPDTTPASTCHAALGGVKYLNCVASLIAICERRGGTLSGTSSSVSCSTN